MPKVIRLPQLGQTMEEGTIVSVLIKEGDKIEKGDVIFEIETDKATLEMESPEEGFVKKLLTQQNDVLPIASPMVVLDAKDAEVSDDFIKSLSEQEDQPTEAPAESAPTPVQQEPANAKVVRLPQLGQTMEEGVVVSILIKEGDKIEKGNVLFEIETDKATLEMESTEEGFVKKILIQQGQVLPVGDPLVVLAPEDEEIPDSFIESLAGSSMEAPAPPAVEAPAAETVSPAITKTTGRVFASPRARMTAKATGIDLTTIKGTGPVGRIVEADVLNAPASAEPKGSAFKPGDRIPLSKFQKITGQKMLQSKRDIPCFYLTVRTDVTEMVKLRTSMNQEQDIKISFNDFLIRAVALGLSKFPSMTGQLDGDFIQLASGINVGLAISVDDGLAAPLVRDADKKTLKEISAYSKALVERARSNKLSADDISGGCLTVSSLGGFGIDSFVPIVVPGQCSILGIGKITDTCVPVDGNILIRKIMDMTLSVDHKVANGAEAAEFLGYVKQLLENPQQLV